MKRIVVVALLVVVIAGAAWWFTRAKPVAVTVLTVGRGAVSATVANTRAGTVDACQRARLSPALGGQIATLPVKNGDRVEKGALLLELWNEDVKAQLTLSERDASASRSLAREACVTADVAKRDADRLMRLHDQKLASEEAADQAEGKAEANAAACTAAQDTSCLYISVPIDEVDAPHVQAGLQARISLDAFPNRTFRGHVRRVAPYVVD